MKQITKMSRLVGLLEKMFNMLNADWFDNALPMPVITVYPTPKAYAHFTTSQVWQAGNERRHEINIASGTLDQPLETVIGFCAHEMIHFLNLAIYNVQDCSRGGVYHNKLFAIEATKHGLNVEKTAKYGWAKTSVSDELYSWICDNADAFREIEMCRLDPYGAVVTGGKTPNGATPVTTSGNSHSRKYQCPVCKTSVRATKTVNIICADCMQVMVET